VERNVGRIDAAIRWSLAVVFFGASLVLNGIPVVALAAAVLALVMVATALTGSCPLYRLLGISTCPRNPATPRHAGGG
jgi:hypothetical protein